MKKLYLMLILIFFLVIIFIFAYQIFQPVDNKPILSLTFDDGYLVYYDVVYPLMEEYGFDGTLFILANESDKFEGKELIGFEQAKEMQDSGWEIGSHTLNHTSLIGLNENEIENQLNFSKQILEEKGFVISSLAFPFGDYNDEVLEVTKKYYESARPMEDGYNPLSMYDQYRLKSKWVMLTSTPEEVCSWITYARDRDLWLILDFHYIGEEVLYRWSFSTENFKEVLDCIKEEDIQVKTIREVLNGKK